MHPVFTIILLVLSNIFMTIAWYGHLQYKDWSWFKGSSLFVFILMSWAFAFFEYCFQVPANKFGIKEAGGAFDLIQLKVLQEVITLSVFTVFVVLFFKQETFKWNHAVSFGCLILAVYFAFKK